MILFVNVWLELLTTCFPTRLTLSRPLSTGLRSSPLRTKSQDLNYPHTPPVQSPFVPSSFLLRNTFYTIDLGARPPTGVYYVRFHRLLVSNPYLGTHVRRLRLVDNTEDGFSNGILWLTHVRTPISRTMVPPEFAFLWTELQLHRGKVERCAR